MSDLSYIYINITVKKLGQKLTIKRSYKYEFYFWAGYDKRLILKQSKAGLNSEFSFSKTGCLTKSKELILLLFFPIIKERKDEFMPLPSTCKKKNMQPYKETLTFVS